MTGAVTHELTVETHQREDGWYRVVGTCSCLHFSRAGTTAYPAVAEEAVDLIDLAHEEHLEAVAAGRQHAPARPGWLP